MVKQVRFSVAPMMDWTDRHCRMFHRLLNSSIDLYTEMVTCGALLHGDTNRFLKYNPLEHPVILQLGGSDPGDLAKCAKLAESAGYDEVNLNCGCPSERVQKGAFGACLMSEPVTVAKCVEAMQDACDIPVTIKCRIGIDESDEYEFLEAFIRENKTAGCQTFIIHARKAWLKGLSPKDNREIPPLNYDRVYHLKQEHPDLNIHINGGIRSLEDIQTHLPHIDGVMIGREAYQNPWFLNELEKEFRTDSYQDCSQTNIVRKMMAYADKEIKENNIKLHDVTRHMHGLFQGQKGAKNWRRHLSDVNKKADNDPSYVLNFLSRFS